LCKCRKMTACLIWVCLSIAMCISSKQQGKNHNFSTVSPSDRAEHLLEVQSKTGNSIKLINFVSKLFFCGSLNDFCNPAFIIIVRHRRIHLLNSLPHTALARNPLISRLSNFYVITWSTFLPSAGLTLSPTRMWRWFAPPLAKRAATVTDRYANARDKVCKGKLKERWAEMGRLNNKHRTIQ